MILNDQLDSHQSKRFNTTFPPAIQQSTLTVKKDQLKQSDSAPNHHMSIFGNNKIQKRSLYAKAQTKKRNEDQTGYYTFTRKTQYDGYSLSNDYKNQSRQLVLFASAESNEVTFAIVLFIHREYRGIFKIIFECTLFSKSITISQESCFQLLLL